MAIYTFNHNVLALVDPKQQVVLYTAKRILRDDENREDEHQKGDRAERTKEREREPRGRRPRGYHGSRPSWAGYLRTGGSQPKETKRQLQNAQLGQGLSIGNGFKPTGTNSCHRERSWTIVE